jgi:hypothetical protein
MTLEPRAERTQQAIPKVMMSNETTSNKCCQLKEIILSFISLSFLRTAKLHHFSKNCSAATLFVGV